MGNEPNVKELVKLFNHLFLDSENTRLEVGAEEPFYKAASERTPAIIYSRADFFSSALHELAHWCIAGPERRKLDDFGYWYEPEGRTQKQQIAFEKVEIKPQALEWLFSLASNHVFNFSADNLSQSAVASETFKIAVRTQAKDYLEKGMPQRARQLFNGLNEYYRQARTVEINDV